MTRVLAVADADSYLKWSAATLTTLPADWALDQVLVASPITPSPDQARSASGRDVPVLSPTRLRRRLRRDRPDVLLLACTGPTVRTLLALPELRDDQRPVLVTGLPGISVPASPRAVDLRNGCDLLVVHSRRERTDFARLAAERAPTLEIALGRLPFLSGAPAISRDETATTEVVFAAQAKVPPAPSDRESILLALAELEPAGSAVVKVRAVAGEQQTHREEHPYAELWQGLVAIGRVAADAVRFRSGPMSSALTSARSLVTVSSTAALEAIDIGVPVLVLSDFGVSAAMINEVFADSGCLGTLADLRAGVAHLPSADWRHDNYFHPVGDDDLLDRLTVLLEGRADGGLPLPSVPRPPLRARLRGLVRLWAPQPVVRLARRLRTLR